MKTAVIAPLGLSPPVIISFGFKLKYIYVLQKRKL